MHPTWWMHLGDITPKQKKPDTEARHCNDPTCMRDPQQRGPRSRRHSVAQRLGEGSRVVRWEQSVLSGRWECSRARWRWRSYNTVNALHTTACLKMVNMYFITMKKKRYHKISKHLKQAIILLGLWRRERQPTPVFLSGELHGQRTQVGYTVQGVAKSRTWLS